MLNPKFEKISHESSSSMSSKQRKSKMLRVLSSRQKCRVITESTKEASSEIKAGTKRCRIELSAKTRERICNFSAGHSHDTYAAFASGQNTTAQFSKESNHHTWMAPTRNVFSERQVGEFSAEDNFNYLDATTRDEIDEPIISETASSAKLSPLELQVLDLQARHPGMLLMVQNAYKYCFYGHDAQIASKLLNIMATTHRSLVTCSVPVTRLHVHVYRLVQAGYKVGVVKQTETAALKAVGESRKGPFARELSHVYSKATLIGDDVNPLNEETADTDAGQPAFIMCIAEGADQRSLGVVALDAGTGEAFFDVFEDDARRQELETRLELLDPVEILAPESLCQETNTLLKHSPAFLERLPDEAFELSASLLKVAAFLLPDDSDQACTLAELAPPVVCALAALLQHLQAIGLHRALQPQRLHRLASRWRHVRLDAVALRDLELLHSWDGSLRGSLLGLMDRTRTKFGSRLLRQWVCQPLCEMSALQERQEAVAELLESSSDTVGLLSGLLTGLPDVDRGLTTILHNRCSPRSLCVVLKSLGQLHCTLERVVSTTGWAPHSVLLTDLVLDTVNLLSTIQPFLDNLDQEAARKGDVTHFLRDYSAFPVVMERHAQMAEVSEQLEVQRADISRFLDRSVDFVTVSGQEFLVEVNVQQVVPASWRKISQTKQCSRYRTPGVEDCFSELCRLREHLASDCQAAWLNFLDTFNQQYFEHKKAVQNMATLDALLALADVSRSPGYCRPTLLDSEDTIIDIEQGRHPIVETLDGGQPFVANSTKLQSPDHCCIVLSGPNMAGKSCYMRQVALITIMAHVGSFVPADAAHITLLDAVFTRMGARDNMFAGQSTLLMELQEASVILHGATRRSLAVIDELGRGTGTCDGAAIALASLRYLATEVCCLTLFVTHYPSVMSLYPDLNYHMGFLLHQSEEAATEELTFLYTVTQGAASRSYGLNVARLAGLPTFIMQSSSHKAHSLESETTARRNVRAHLQELWHSECGTGIKRVAEADGMWHTSGIDELAATSQ